MASKQWVLTAAMATMTAGILATTARAADPEIAAPETADPETADPETADPETTNSETVDTSHWRCRFCAFPSGWQGTLRGGLGYVSEDSAKFGEYSDLDEDGFYPALGGTVTYYGEQGRRWDLITRDLGLDTRSISLSGGRQGVYELGLSYDGIVHHVSDSGATPFSASSGEALRLPAGFTRATSTQAMADLPASQRGIELNSHRRRAGLDFVFRQSDNWSYTFDVSHEERSGRQLTGGAFITSTAQLPADIDYRTDSVDLGARYAADLWQLSVDYRGSLFRNGNSELLWDNPYSMPGPDQGRQSTAPDNQAHQLSLSGSYRFGMRGFFVGDVTAGYMRQDEQLLPPTSNPGIASPALPRDSAEAEVKTLTANGRLTYRTPLPRLSVILHYRFNRRDNDTPRDVFTQVVTDSFVGADRVNEPVSYHRLQASLKTNYRLSGHGRLSSGLDYERFDRSFGDNPTTDEYTLWGEHRTRVSKYAQVHAKISRAQRSGSGQGVGSAAPTPQNPRVTRFDVADRTRTALELGLHLSPGTRTGISISGRLIDDDYDDTAIGRTDGKRVNISLDLSTQPRDDMTVFGYVSHERNQTGQANSQGFSVPDWRAETEDTFVTAGLGGRITGIKGKIDLGMELIYSDSNGDADVETGGNPAGFPDLETHRMLARLQGDYHLRKNLTLGMSLAYERYRSDAFYLDGVNPGTVDKLLALGEDSPSYDVVTSLLTIEYGF